MSANDCTAQRNQPNKAVNASNAFDFEIPFLLAGHEMFRQVPSSISYNKPSNVSSSDCPASWEATEHQKLYYTSNSEHPLVRCRIYGTHFYYNLHQGGGGEEWGPCLLPPSPPVRALPFGAVRRWGLWGIILKFNRWDANAPRITAHTRLVIWWWWKNIYDIIGQ